MVQFDVNMLSHQIWIAMKKWDDLMIIHLIIMIGGIPIMLDWHLYIELSHWFTCINQHYILDKSVTIIVILFPNYDRTLPSPAGYQHNFCRGIQQQLKKDWSLVLNCYIFTNTDKINKIAMQYEVHIIHKCDNLILLKESCLFKNETPCALNKMRRHWWK